MHSLCKTNKLDLLKYSPVLFIVIPLRGRRTLSLSLVLNVSTYPENPWTTLITRISAKLSHIRTNISRARAFMLLADNFLLPVSLLLGRWWATLAATIRLDDNKFVLVCGERYAFRVEITRRQTTETRHSADKATHTPSITPPLRLLPSAPCPTPTAPLNHLPSPARRFDCNTHTSSSSWSSCLIDRMCTTHHLYT